MKTVCQKMRYIQNTCLWEMCIITKLCMDFKILAPKQMYLPISPFHKGSEVPSQYYSVFSSCVIASPHAVNTEVYLLINQVLLLWPTPISSTANFPYIVHRHLKLNSKTQTQHSICSLFLPVSYSSRKSIIAYFVAYVRHFENITSFSC